MVRQLRLLIFIPAYNEAKTLPSVVDNVLKGAPGADYIIIDDGSTDGTAALCKERGYNYLRLPVNLGLDGVFNTGVRFAYENGYDAAVPIDGDGQHDAAYVPKMLKKLGEGCDIVIGSRFVDAKKGGGLRMGGSRVISVLFWLATGVRFADPTSGMRMVNRRVMECILKNPTLGPEPDTWAYFVKNGARLAEVPVNMKPREHGSSYFTPLKSVFYMLRMSVSILFLTPFRKGGFK